LKKLYIPTLIIGSGLVGRTVANWLKTGEYIIVERGEYRSFLDMRERYKSRCSKDKDFWENARHAYCSDLPFNQTYDLSGTPTCFSQFEFIGGGTSNRWDGNAVRIPEYIFSSRDFLAWPISYEEIAPWYELAEKQLNLCGDYGHGNPGNPFTRISSGDYYREIFNSIGLGGYLRNQAKNPIRQTGSQNICVGAGACEACPSDAKLRPEHLYPNQSIAYGTLVDHLKFEGHQAKSAICRTMDEDIHINFDRVIIAAHAVESAKLLHRSRMLPRYSNKNIGRYYQDHAQCDLRVLLPKPIEHRRLPFKSSFEIRTMTGLYDGIDVLVSTSLASRALSPAGWRELYGFSPASALDLRSLHERISGVTITYEMPPKPDCYVDFSGAMPVVRDESWMNNVQQYNKILGKVIFKLESLGIKVLESRPHFRHAFGQHHLAGTLNMSSGHEAVVDTDFKIIGTQNVYIAGTAVIPRLGASTPTLTAVALANMLGKSIST